MKNLHTKSPCCQEKVYHFGNRRRQCSKCKRTWRIRMKKRGRESKREGTKFVIRYLRHEIPSLYAKARAEKTSEAKLKRRLKKSRDFFLSHTSWPTLPKREPLIAIADAAIYFLEEITYTIHFILLRKLNENYAVIAQPYVRKSSEIAQGWYETFNRLPQETKDSICALVCDGHGGLTSIAQKHNWIIQRCHFHLIARLQSRRSKWKLSRHKDEGKKLYALVNYILTSKNEDDISAYIGKLNSIVFNTNSYELRTLLKGFTKHYQDYRSYLYYPELNLPKTTNACESLIGSLRNLSHRARGFRTIGSLTKWINAFLKSKQKFKCNGYNFQPN